MYKLETLYHNEPIDYIVCNQLNNLKLSYHNDKDLMSEFYIALHINNLVFTYGYEIVSMCYNLVFGLKLELKKSA
jgi:hypothetical protein